MTMKRPQLVSKGALSRMLQSAQQAWIRRDFQQNIDLLERASRMDPANWTILMQLGKFQGLRYNYPEAETYFERAIRLAPRKAEALVALRSDASAAAISQNPTCSINIFCRAVEQKDAHAGDVGRGWAEL